MNEAPNLRDRLLSVNQTDPDLKQRYETELQAILHMRLRPSERWYYGAFSLLSFLLSIGFGIAAVAVEHLDVIIRLMLVAAAVNCTVHGVRIALVVGKGQFDRKRTPSQKLTIGTIYLGVILALFFVYSMRADSTGVHASVLTIMFAWLLLAVILMVAGWIAHWISLAALKTREELLEIKLQLAAMAKKTGST